MSEEGKSLEAEIASILKNHVSKRIYDDTVARLERIIATLKKRADDADETNMNLQNRLIDSAARNNEHVAMIAQLRQEFEKEAKEERDLNYGAHHNQGARGQHGD